MGFMITIGLLIALIVMLVKGNNRPVQVSARPLSSYTATSTVSVLLQGPVGAVSEQQQIQISINRQYVTYQELKGFDGHVARSRRFANTTSAYRVFLGALSHSGFDRANNDPTLASEEGRCPLGRRYVFSMTDGGRQIQRTWITNCGGPHTFLGNADATIQLFQNQVPGYNELSNDVRL